MTIELKKDIAEDLISYKLQKIQMIISELLSRWNEISCDTFLNKARNGTYQNSENDAIDLRQLLLEEKKLLDLLKAIS